MAKYFGTLIVIISAVFVTAKDERSLSCEVQCRRHFGFQGKTRHLDNKKAYEAFSVEGCYCIRNKGSPRKPRSLGDKTKNNNASMESWPQNETNTINKTEIQTNKIEPMSSTKASGNGKPKSERCNVPKEKNVSLPNMTEPGNVELSSIHASFWNQAGWFANITWNPPKANLSALTDYLVMWHSKDTPDIYARCRRIPKNTTFTVLTENDDWKYPSDLSILVVSRPRHGLFSKERTMKAFSPIKIPTGIPISFPKRVKKSTSGKSGFMVHWPIMGGVLGGAFVLGSLIVIYRRRKRPHIEAERPFIIEPNNVNTESKPLNLDTYFASYLPESEKYSDEVATVAFELGMMGYKVVFDQVDSVCINEIGFNMWVDKHILEAKKYIVFCTPGYVKLWQSLATSAPDSKLNHVSEQDLVRVRYEIKRISDVYSEKCSTSRIVCIQMDPKMSTKQLPPWMNHNMLLWPEQRDDIIRRLNDQKKMIMIM